MDAAANLLRKKIHETDCRLAGPRHRIDRAGGRGLTRRCAARRVGRRRSPRAARVLSQDGPRGRLVSARRRSRLPRHVRQRLQRPGGGDLCRHDSQDLRLEAAARREDGRVPARAAEGGRRVLQRGRHGRSGVGRGARLQHHASARRPACLGPQTAVRSAAGLRGNREEGLRQAAGLFDQLLPAWRTWATAARSRGTSTAASGRR